MGGVVSLNLEKKGTVHSLVIVVLSSYMRTSRGVYPRHKESQSKAGSACAPVSSSTQTVCYCSRLKAAALLEALEGALHGRRGARLRAVGAEGFHVGGPALDVLNGVAAAGLLDVGGERPLANAPLLHGAGAARVAVAGHARAAPVALAGHPAEVLPRGGEAAQVDADVVGALVIDQIDALPAARVAC